MWIFERLKFGKGNLSGIRLRILMYNQTKKKKIDRCKAEIVTRRFDRANSQKEKKLPRRERIAKLIASRFSSAITEYGKKLKAKKEKTKERSRNGSENASNENAGFLRSRAKETKITVHYIWRIRRRRKRRNSREESVWPSTTLGRPKGPNLVSALEENFEVT